MNFLASEPVLLPGEEWRPIPGHEGYEASSLGRIRSLDRYVEIIGRWGSCVRFYRGRVLKQYNSNTSTGGSCLGLHLGKDHNVEVGRAVLAAFFGAPPSDEHEGAHLDGDGSNNTLGNLVWATRAEISEFAISNGATPVGERNGGRTISANDAQAIIERYAKGETAKALAKEYSLTRSGVSMIASGRAWAHVPSAMRPAAADRAKENLVKGRARGHQVRIANGYRRGFQVARPSQ